MTLPDNILHSGGTSRTTGISSQAISAGANYLGSEIDNSSNKDTECDIQITFTCGTAPTEDDVLEIYILYAMDGTNYEDGDATPTDPKKLPACIVAAKNTTSAQKILCEGIRLRPYKYKILVKSELDQSATTTVLLYTNNPEIVD